MNKIGIALGSGAARGWAHIGVLKALLERGIKPDIVAGSSIGAVVGAAYAEGKLDQLHEWVLKLTRTQVIRLFDLSLFRGGFIKGYRVLETIWGKNNKIKIEELALPFTAVATDIDNGREIWLTKGDLLPALRASFALPGFFKPVNINQHWLVDGGIVNPVPVSICRAMGADKIIAVNLNKDILGRHRLKKHTTSTTLFKRIYENKLGVWPFSNNRGREPENENRVETINAPGYFNVLSSSINIMMYRITNSRLAGDAPDVIIEPMVSKLELFDFDRAKEAIAEGYASVERMDKTLQHIFTPD